MTIRIVVGRTEGFVSSVGFVVDGLPFLCRGTDTNGLHWAPAEVRQRAVRELRFIAEYLKSAGVVVENIEVLEKL